MTNYRHKLCCESCPWGDNFEGAINGVNLGCLPSPSDMLGIREKESKNMSCHNDEKTPCMGMMGHFMDKKEDTKFKEFPILSYTKWYRGAE